MFQQIRLDKVMRLVSEKDGILVDIRDPVRFRDFHVDGSTYFSLRNVGLLRKYATDKCPIILIYETQDEETLRSFHNYMCQFAIDPKRIYCLKLD